MKISSLAKYVNETNNCTKGRNSNVIDTITIHCTASASEKTTSKAIVDYLASTTRQASCNYAIGGNDSNDISCGVREEYRAWTSGGTKTVCGESGSMNDHHAITIEVVSNLDGSVVLEQAIENTIRLCVDICKRYGKTKAIWFGDNAKKNVSYKAKSNEMKFTWHKWFANKSCPGPYIMSKFQYIIDEINKRLSNVIPSTPTPTPVKKELKEGDVIQLKQGCTYYNGKSIPSWVFNKTLYYRGKNSNGVIFSTLKTGAITGVVKEENIVK